MNQNFRAEQQLELENQLFTKLMYSISNYIQPIQHNAQLIGVRLFVVFCKSGSFE